MNEFTSTDYSRAWREWFKLCTSEKCGEKERDVLYSIGSRKNLPLTKAQLDSLSDILSRRGEIWRQFESFCHEHGGTGKGSGGKRYKDILKDAYESNAANGAEVQTKQFYRYLGRCFRPFFRNLLRREAIGVKYNSRGRSVGLLRSFDEELETGGSLGDSLCNENLPDYIPVCGEEGLDSAALETEISLLDEEAVKLGPEVEKLLSRPLLVAIAAKKRKVSLAAPGLERFSGLSHSRLSELPKAFGKDLSALIFTTYPNDEPAWYSLQTHVIIWLLNLLENWLALPENEELLRFLESKEKCNGKRAPHV